MKIRDSANRIPEHVIEGKGGASTAHLVIGCCIIHMWLVTGDRLNIIQQTTLQKYCVTLPQPQITLRTQ